MHPRFTWADVARLRALGYALYDELRTEPDDEVRRAAADFLSIADRIAETLRRRGIGQWGGRWSR